MRKNVLRTALVLISAAVMVYAAHRIYQEHSEYREGADSYSVLEAYMAYIQLSLYGIPAMVIHGNTLTMEEWDRWYTPCALVPFSKAQSEDGDIAV